MVAVVNKTTGKMKLLACQSDERADRFVRLFNLVSAFTAFDQAVAAERAAIQAGHGPPHSHYTHNDQRRIEQWVSHFANGRDGGLAETVTFNNEGIGACSSMLRILSQFFSASVTALSFSSNSMSDSSLSTTLAPLLGSFRGLQRLEITGNDLTTQSLEILGRLFQSCEHLSVVSLAHNRVGGGQSASSAERHSMSFFLSKLFTELHKPRRLDLSFNSLTDECLYPVVKYVFANHGCSLETFNLEHNCFSPRGSRTLLKAYAISPTRTRLAFRYGPVPLSFENLRAGFVTRQDHENIAALGAKPERVHAVADLEDSREELPQAVELVIQRRSNNFFEAANVLKPTPVNKAERQMLNNYLKRIDMFVDRRAEIDVETLRDFVQEVTGQEVAFEIPRYHLEPLFNVINEKLEAAIEHENIYILEVLLDCLKFMNARNIPAEKKYFDLAREAQQIAHELLEVLNLERKDEGEMQRLLVKHLKRGKQIGLRGELIDTARHLYLLTEKVLGEMRGQASAVSDDEDDAIYDVNEEDRPANVYDNRLDKHVGLSAEELGLTTDVEAHLAYHPYSTDYCLIATLNLDYVKKNLAEAKRFLKDEESYSYRNIFERCSVLLSDTGEQSSTSITYNLARNDSNLKLARIVFRYRSNLDQLFSNKKERPERTKLFLAKLKAVEQREPGQLYDGGLAGSGLQRAHADYSGRPAS